MTREQREIYTLLLLAGREEEALAYRDSCEQKTDAGEEDDPCES